jgi:hypothetical protein
VIIIILLITSLLTVWWFHYWDGEGKTDNLILKGKDFKDFKLTEVHVDADWYQIENNVQANFTYKETIACDTDEFYDRFGAEYGHFTDIFAPIYYLMIVSLVTIFITLIVMIMNFSHRFKLIILIISIIIILIPPIYFVNQLNDFINKNPNQFPEDSITGSEKGEDFEKSWGFGLGWYLTILSAILMIIVFGFNFKIRKEIMSEEFEEEEESDFETIHPTMERYPEPDDWSR